MKGFLSYVKRVKSNCLQNQQAVNWLVGNMSSIVKYFYRLKIADKKTKFKCKKVVIPMFQG